MIDKSPQKHRNSNKSDNSSVYDSDGRSIRSNSSHASGKSNKSGKSFLSIKSNKSTKSAPGGSRMKQSNANMYPGMRSGAGTQPDYYNSAGYSTGHANGNGQYIEEDGGKKKNLFKRIGSKSSIKQANNQNDDPAQMLEDMRRTQMIEEIRRRSKSEERPASREGRRFKRLSSKKNKGKGKVQEQDWNPQKAAQEFNWNYPETHNQNRGAEVNYGL